jgi:hypothetical protein
MARNGEKEIIKGHCPACGEGRNAEVIAHHEDQWQDEEVQNVNRNHGHYRLLQQIAKQKFRQHPASF